MADYKIHLGVKLNTSDINAQISKYKASPIDIKANLDTNGITKAINSYKSKPISIDSKLNTDGITEKIRAYTPPKKIHLESDLSTAGIDKKINNYVPKKPIVVDVELDKSSINQQIANAKPTQSIIVNAELKKSAISEAIRSYKSTTPIKVMVDPDFNRVDAVIKNYIPRNLLKVNIKLNKGEIDSQIKNFQTKTKIEVGAKLRDNAIETAIRTYAGKELVPITVDFKVGQTQEITNKINEYKNKDVSIPVKLRPAQAGFDSEITKKPVKVQATLDPDGIDSVIETFKPTKKIKVGVQLDSKDVNEQVAKLPKPTDPLDVDVRLDSTSVNNAIAKLTPTSRLKVGVDLKTDDINQQIDAIHPTSNIKVNVNLDNSDINTEIGRQNTQSPAVINVRLDRDSLNEQIRNFKTQTKLKVGIKLDFVGIAKQIKDYKTKSKLKVGVELDKDSIAQQIATVKTDTPIKLGVELDPEDINKIKGQVSEIKQQIEALGNVRINFGGSNVGATNTTTDSGGTGTITSKSVGSAGTNLIQGIREADITIANTEDSAAELRKALEQIGFAGDDITGITNKFKEMDVVVNRVVTRLDKNQNMMLTIMGTDTAGRNNVTLTHGKDVDGNLVEYTKVSQKIGETVSFLKQQKKAAADLTNQINQINRAATDSNARKPIQDTAHLDSLKSKYDEIILAIETMGNASSDTFEDERIKVKALISEYKSLKSEYKNAENVSTKYDGNSYSTGLEEARQDLIAFKREASNFPQIVQTVKELDDAFEKVGDAGSLQDFTRQLGVAKSELSNLKAEANDAYKSLTDAQNKIESLSTQVARLNPEVNPEQIAKLSAQLEEAEADYNALKKAFSSKLSTSQFGTLQANADDLTQKLEVIEAKHRDTKAELAKKIAIKLETGKFTTQVQQVHRDAGRLADVSQELKVKLEALDNAHQKMSVAFKSGSVDEQIVSYRQYLSVLADVENQLKQNNIQQQNAVDAQKLKLSKQGLSHDMTSWLRDNSAAAKRFGDEVKRLQAQLNACDNSVDFNNIKQEFRNIQKEAKALGLTGLTTLDKIKYKLKEYMAYFSVAEVFMYASQGLRDMFEQVKLIDSAMTELKKVTDETAESYNQFLSNAAKRSKEIGTTIDGLVSSTADFARLGYGFEDAQGLAEVANIYAVVGDEIEGVEGATESLISTMAAFKDEMNGMNNSDFAMSIVDKFNEIGNNFAISSGGIGEALERSASSLQAANNTIDESIALITAANTVVQSPDAVGTAFKTISMRIRGAKTELEEAGLETEGMVESTASLRQEILALSGVDIMENANEFKSTYKIMDELAQKWKDLSDIQQASITELIAGKRQGNIVSSLMTNFDVAREALETSLNSSGSAIEEHEKWQKSLEAQTLKLEAAWQSLSQTFMSSKFLHGALDAVIGLVDGIEALVDTIGVIPTLATAFGIFQSFKGEGIFQPIIDEATGAAKGMTSIFGKAANNIQTSLNNINISNGFSASLNQDDVASLIKYNGQLQANVDKTMAWNDCMANASVAAQNVARSNAFLSDGLNGYIKSQQAATVSTLAQNKSLSSAKVLLNEYYSGCKTTGMGVDDFRVAVQQTNPQLAAQMTATGSAAAGLRAYTIATIGAKAGALALKIGVMALNAALTMGIGLIVGELMSAVTNWINKEENLAEEVEEVTTKFNEQHKSLQKMKGDFDTDNESSMISRYAKLSKGVDNLGQNVSLTTDEYSEYLNIVDKIADTFPSLVTGYDSQGNAILKCKDNVSELTKEYERLIEANADSVLKDNLNKIAEDFENKIDDSAGQSFGESAASFGSTIFNSVGGLFGLSWVPEIELTGTALQSIKDMLAAKEKGKEAIDEAIRDSTRYGDALHDYEAQIITALRGQGVDIDSLNYEEKLAEIIEQNPAKLQAIIDKYEVDMENFASSMKAISTATLTKAFDISGSEYYNMSDTLKNVMYNFVNGLDADFYKQYQTNPEGIIDYIHSILDQLKAVSGEGGFDIEAAFDLQTQFNGDEISYGDYVKGLESAGKTIDQLISDGKLDEEIGSQLKLSIGLDDEGIVKEYDVLLKKLSEKSDTYDFNITEEQAKNLLDGLSSEELAIAVDVITEMESNGVEETIEEVRNAIDRQLAIKGLTLELNIEVEKTKLEALTTALTESFSGSGLSSDSITAVEGMFSGLSSYDPSKLFERTANGIKLNNDELRRLNNESKKTNIAKLNKEMDSLGDIYNQTQNELYDLTYGTEAYNKKAAELKSIEDRIKATEKLASQYEGLASAYQEWQMAESAGSQRGMYEGLLEGWENVNDELSRGWVDDGTREFLELLKGETTTIVDGNGAKKEINIATASAKDLKKVWKDLDKTIEHTTYSVHDFFTVDDDGNSTSKGVFNFLDAIGQMEEEKFNGKDVVKRDKDGNIIGFDFELVGGDKVIAEALGISEELVQIMKRASADAGFVVTFDGSYEQLDVLKEKAQKAAESLNQILKKNGKGDKVYSFDFNSDDEEDIITQLGKANDILNGFKKGGTVDLSMEGAEEALNITRTLQSMLDEIQRPAYMKIEVSQVEKELQDPLRNLQELRTLTEQEHQIRISGGSTVDLEKQKQEIYDYFENLDPEIKAELGLVDDKGNPLTGTALQDKLNSGDIAIEATVDIQMSMDDKLGILVDKALYDAGIIDKKEFTKRVNVYLEADEVDDSDVDDKVEETFEEGNGKNPVVQKEVKIEIVENTNDKLELDELINNVNPDPIKKTVIVEYFAEHSDVDDYTPNQKKALVEFIANTDNLDEYTPEEKQAIVEYLTDSADPDSWTPEQKEAVAKFIKESSEVDSYTPDQKKAIAKFIKDSIEPDTYTPPSPDATVTFNKDTTDVDTYDPPNFTRYVTYYAKKAFSTAAEKGKKVLEDRFGIVNGTANVNGTAFKQGSWGTKNSGTALVGELGRETLVRGGRYYTIGDDGAEFIKYQKGDIIFNHKQTEELFKNGKVTADGGRAKALVNGTAFAQGTAFAEGNVSTETFDWIETLLTRLERTIDNFVKAADDTYSSWSEREAALYHKDEDGKETGALVDNQRLINELAKAIDKDNADSYWRAANAIDLDEDIKKKVRNGVLDPNDVQNEADSKKIQEYKTLWENYLEAQDKYTEAVRTQAELQAKYFDNIISKYDDILQGFEHTESMLSEYISQAEEKGHIVSKSYYQSLKDNKNAELAQLRAEQSELVTERSRLEEEGIDVGSEKWYELCKEIDSVTLAIEEGNTALIEYNNAMRDINWQVFDLIQERISDITAEADFFIDLMSNDKLFDDNGQMNNKGLTTMALHFANRDVYKGKAQKYADEITDIDNKISTGELDETDQNVIARRQELIEKQRECILAAEQEEDAIKDLISEGYDKQLDALQDRIDLYEESIQSAKDLYDYEKNIAEQVQNISSLEKQLRAYEGDNDEETRATVQKLKVELEKANADLEETQYDKFISDQSALLDELYESYSEVLNSRLDDLSGLLQEKLDEVNTNLGKGGAIESTLSGLASDVGVEMSEEFSNIWGEGGKGTEGVTLLGNVNSTLTTIAGNVQTLVTNSNTEANEKIDQPQTQPVANQNPTGGSGGGNKGNGGSNGGNKSTGGDGKIKIGDRVKFVSGKYYYDSQGVNPAGSKNHGKYVYITNVNNRPWATHQIHISTGKKLGSGDLGWLKKEQISGYATGKKNFLDNEIAWTQENGQEFIVRPSDGAILTPIAKSDSVLTSAASSNIWDMANSPAEFIKDNLNLGTANVPNNSNVNNSCVQNFENIVFSMPNVKNYGELLSELQKDPKFDKLIKAMTIDQIAGKSSLAKNKSIR